jgi:uncharacterized membrane protein
MIMHMMFAYLMAVVLFALLLIERRGRAKDNKQAEDRVWRANQAVAGELARATLKEWQRMNRAERRTEYACKEVWQ